MPCGNSADNFIGCYILADHGSGSNDGTCSNVDSGEDRGIAANPDIMPNCWWSFVYWLVPVVWIIRAVVTAGKGMRGY